MERETGNYYATARLQRHGEAAHELGSISAGAVGATMPGPSVQTATPLLELAARIREEASRAYRMAEGVERAADQLMGERPGDASVEATPDVPVGGQVGEVYDAVQTLERAHDALSRQLQRLGQLTG